MAKPRSNLVILSRSLFLGKRATKRVYPGKKNITGKAKIMRGTSDGRKIMIGKSKAVIIHMHNN